MYTTRSKKLLFLKDKSTGIGYSFGLCLPTITGSSMMLTTDGQTGGQNLLWTKNVFLLKILFETFSRRFYDQLGRIL